jgi:hypothetical protein
MILNGVVKERDFLYGELSWNSIIKIAEEEGYESSAL